MSDADLIQQRLQTLSPAQHAQVFDFVEFWAHRRAVELAKAPVPPRLGQSPVAAWLSQPIEVPAFTPLSREEANARDHVGDATIGLPTRLPPDAA